MNDYRKGFDDGYYFLLDEVEQWNGKSVQEFLDYLKINNELRQNSSETKS
jgi:hypothetical protein